MSMRDTMALYEGQPSFSDPEDFVDDIENEQLSDLLQGTPLEAGGIDGSCVVVDNVPQVGPERLDELKRRIHKIFSQFGDITTEFYPEADGLTKGYVFMEYATSAQALKAVQSADGYKLKGHTLRVYTFSDFDRCMNVESDDWEPPEVKPFKDVGNLHHWLLDPDCCDQYSVMYESGQKVAVFSNDATEPVVVMEREEWRDTYVRWSPKGTYLVTFHQKGIALWGSEKLELIQRFNHQGVSRTDFSPCERYLVTYSPPMDTEEDPQDPKTHTHIVIIWDIKSGQNKRDFHCESCTHRPIFKWSHDGMFFARMTQDKLSIYETPSMGLLGNKSLKIIGIKDFSWSPRDNIVAFWIPEDKHISARATLMQIPSRQEIRHHSLLFNLVNCKMHWQRNGDYLCVKVGRIPNGAQGVVTNFEIFRMREKMAPVDVVAMKDSVVAFALEPNGSRFAVVHAESPGRHNASVYHIKNNGKIELMKTFENQQVNSIFWSPQGRFLVLAGLGKKEEDEEYQGLRSMNGALVFLDTLDCTMMNTAEHYAATDVEWDPTGRYVVTSVSWWRHKMDNAYWLWTSQGHLLKKNNKERFCQLLWRPRPATLLSDEQIKAISENMKRFSKVFEQKDRLSRSKASKKMLDRRRAMVEEYQLYRQKASQAYREKSDLRLKLREGVDTNQLDGNVDDCEEETVEFLISEERVPVRDL